MSGSDADKLNVDSIIQRLLEGETNVRAVSGLFTDWLEILSACRLFFLASDVYGFLLCSAWKQARKECTTVGRRNSRPLPQVQGNIPQPAYSFGAGSASKDLW